MNSYLRFNQKDGSCISVAINFDENSQHLIKTAVSLCRATKAKLRLVHSCEVWTYHAPYSGGFLPIADLMQIANFEEVRKAESRLRELAETVAEDVVVETKLLNGKAAKALIADAVANDVRLILVGAPGLLKKFVPTGFSTTLGLLANATVPVLAIPYGTELNFAQTDLGILVCDSLSGSDQTLVEAAMNFAGALSGSVIHAHINGLGRDQLEAMINMAAASGYTALNPETSVDDLIQAHNEVLERRMGERVRDMAPRLRKAGGKYAARVVSGGVEEQLDKLLATAASEAKIVAFGQHQTLHRKPFSLGRLPYRAMLRQDRPLLIIPTAK